VKLAETGTYTPQEIVEKLKALTGRVEASFLLDRLDYMRKGGRCSAVVALGANLLHLKPCIEVVNGKMQVGKKYRGSFETCILNYVQDRLEGRKDVEYERIFITHTPVADGLVEAVREAISTYAPFTEIIETEAGCTVSCHCGPGTLGILFLRKA
jgi:DegV family protein with EDD domain